jgi:hypothetical protein
MFKKTEFVLLSSNYYGREDYGKVLRILRDDYIYMEIGIYILLNGLLLFPVLDGLLRK